MAVFSLIQSIISELNNEVELGIWIFFLKMVATAKKNIWTKQDSSMEWELPFYFILFLSALGFKNCGDYVD